MEYDWGKGIDWEWVIGTVIIVVGFSIAIVTILGGLP